MLSIVERTQALRGAKKQNGTLTIDGQEVQARGHLGDARRGAGGLAVPRLYATDQLEAFGSCRLCLVQIEGMKGLPASCTTPVAQGMKVTTQNKQIADVRRGVMELYISDHPLDCLTCPANGHCELQDMAGAVGLREVRYGYDGANHLDAQKDESNPYFTFDASKCIVCSRCVRACDERQGTFALTIEGRGFDSKVAASQNEPFMDSECVSCGACVQACPTATLSEKTLIEKGQAEHSVDHDLRLLRRRLFVPRGDAGRGARAHGAEHERHGQSRPFLRQGALRDRLRHASGPHHEADGTREDHRRMARGVVGGGDFPRRQRAEAHPGEIRP